MLFSWKYCKRSLVKSFSRLGEFVGDWRELSLLFPPKFMLLLGLSLLIGFSTGLSTIWQGVMVILSLASAYFCQLLELVSPPEQPKPPS